MKDFIALSKPRIVVMVAVTCAIGYSLAGGSDKALLAWTCVATILSAAACGALNQLFEAKRDALMRRTSGRPLPQGRLTQWQALLFGVICLEVSLALLFWKVNALAALLTAMTMGLYLLIYTPMKTKSPQSTWSGAAAGAMPPLIGWAAARGSLSPEAYALFAIQFLWQIPHFQAIFWIYREDYARAGFRVAAVVDPAGHLTAMTIAIHSLALLGASLLPVYLGMAGLPYAYSALALGAGFLALGLRASQTLSLIDSRRLFLASLLYLPIIFGLMVAGRTGA